MLETRRTICVTKGYSPYYNAGQTASASDYYPIPVPSGANHVNISMSPSGQYIYIAIYDYDEETGQYTPRINRTTWTQLTNGTYDRGISDNGKPRFMIVNLKYDEAGTSYPVEPTSMTITFSEVA